MNLRINLLIVFVLLALRTGLQAQEITLPDCLPEGHPRVLTVKSGKTEILNLLEKEVWARDVFQKLRERTDKYADKKPEWLTSRLQMYWNSRATQVYVKGEIFSHAGGPEAPVPTVRYTGARSTATIYARPRLEDILPYMDDEKGLLFHNTTKPDRPLEWAEPSKTGRNIESINREIMGIARDAAFLYWVTGEKKYAALASSVFDTYMSGMFYREVPVDLNRGHQQTLVGMCSFEVIHEDILEELVPLYDFLYDYLSSEKSEKMQLYAAAFKKWADNIIENGVPHNNWNLIQARFILNIGQILEDNKVYTDGKGRQYYIDYVLNKSSIRQWSLTDLMAYGFDVQTGIWAECPGYSVGVVGDFANIAALFDLNFNYDLIEKAPIIAQAVAVTPQYLFPNMNLVGFGDTHPGKLRSDIFKRMVMNARKYGKKEEEQLFTAMLKLFDSTSAQENIRQKVRVDVNSFFIDKPLLLDKSVPSGKIEDYVTPTFWAPNVSWFVQRNGMDMQHSLMISQNASEGNHMHANGISMELYGKGYTLGPDAGIGSGYFSLDYAEYYSQFPSHNTVCVDGISSYPVMKSNHAFELRGCYPQPLEKDGIYKGITYSDVYFREPESCSDQTRLMSIVTTSPESGYYVDIFRSRKVARNDKMHDYFYHNLGQEMDLTGVNGEDLNLKPTEELAFAGAHLYGYSYLFDKKCTETENDIKTTFKINKVDGDHVYMNMWMKGEKDRTVFTALSPVTEGLSRTPGMPYDIKNTPTLTFVARQKGEAWLRPFVAVYEPSTVKEPGSILSVSFFNPKSDKIDCSGICVKNKSGRTDYIFSSEDSMTEMAYADMRIKGRYSLIGKGICGDQVFFLGNGSSLKSDSVEIIIPSGNGTATVERKKGIWFYSSTHPCTIKIEDKMYELPTSKETLVK